MRHSKTHYRESRDLWRQAYCSEHAVPTVCKPNSSRPGSPVEYCASGAGGCARKNDVPVSLPFAANFHIMEIELPFFGILR
jgi:hypothetical protein